jgi:uncharacterized membrane protein
MNDRTNTEKLVITALITIITATMTIVVAIPVPFTNGYVHPGDSMILLGTLILGRRRGAFAAGVGSALADVIIGYFFWAPFTLVIKGIMAYVTGLIIEKCEERRRNLVISCASIITAWLLFNAAALGAVMRASNAANAASLAAAVGAEGGASSLTAAVRQIEAHLMLSALLIPAAMLLIAFVLRKKKNVAVPLSHIIGMTGGGLLMVFGYYVAGSLIYGNTIVAIFSIPANIAQFVGGFFIASLLAAALRHTSARRYFVYQNWKGSL